MQSSVLPEVQVGLSGTQPNSAGVGQMFSAFRTTDFLNLNKKCDNTAYLRLLSEKYELISGYIVSNTIVYV